LPTDGYRVFTLNDFFKSDPSGKVIKLRHDIDKNPGNAIPMDRLESRLNTSASYYCRNVKESFNPEAMSQIVNWGHELGYHYEDIYLGEQELQKVHGSRFKSADYREELLDLAVQSFERNLKKFREIAPIRTICMHGSPLYKLDNRLIWDRINYRDYDIVGEPYFDLDFKSLLYLTDTGRKWDGSAEVIRDKVSSGFSYQFHSTKDIIQACNDNILPDKIMLNIHSQRWSNNPVTWTVELISQNLKNIIKKHILQRRNRGMADSD
ncbi:MAG: hypothetical protein H8D46_00245, partial [FCB group bacterium]|nr:hypothetical protein [FCB group bacterium]